MICMNKYIIVTGMDGSGKTSFIKSFAKKYNYFNFKLPYDDYVRINLNVSGKGSCFGDIYTDVLLFITDYRLTLYKMKEWIKDSNLISQRGLMDHFIFNKVMGYSYSKTKNLLNLDKVFKPKISIYFICDYKVAYNRIKDDQTKDKFETLNFMKKQYAETVNFYKSINKNKLLKDLFPEKRFVVDTTNLTKKQTFEKVESILKENKIV